VKARKFKDLQAANGDDLKQIEPIDRVPRMLQAPEITGGLPFHDAVEAVELEAARVEHGDVSVEEAESV